MTWRRLVREARDQWPFAWEKGTRKAMGGHCWHIAKTLQGLVGGQIVRGYYHGAITSKRNFLWSREPDGSHLHHWLEVNGRIVDPTWWAFTDGPLRISEWDSTDWRYKRQAAVTERGR